MEITLQSFLEGLEGEYCFAVNRPCGTIDYVSRSVESVLGFHESSVIGRNWRDFVDTNLPLNFLLEERHEQRFAGSGIHRYPIAVRNANGQLQILDICTFGAKDENGNITANHSIITGSTRLNGATSRLYDREARTVSIKNRLARLTPREKQVVRMLATGRLNHHIAETLGVTTTHIERQYDLILAKLEIDSLEELKHAMLELSGS